MELLEKKRVMGILNITPDSFFKETRSMELEKILSIAQQMLQEGADILDIGGESSRPGSERITLEEERKRVIPAIQALRKKFPDAILSVDTYKPEIAEEALHLGCHMINDIYALRKENMKKIVAKHKAYCVLMHMKGDPQTMQKDPFYEDVVQEVFDFFLERIEEALLSGIEKNKIILDPGIGFGKTKEHNIQLLQAIPLFKKLGYPILIGASRKSLIGDILGIPVEERKNGSVVIHTIAAYLGASLVRTHDVKETKEALTIVEAFQSISS